MPRETGFTLMEVMVALLISAIGLLGLAALQATAKRNMDMSIQYSQANLLALDLAERMRANPQGMRSGFYSGIDTDAELGTAADCSAGCSPALIAANDILAWSQAVQDTDRILNGIGTTQINGSRLTITVKWMGDPQHYAKRQTTCPPLDCMSIEVELP